MRAKSTLVLSSASALVHRFCLFLSMANKVVHSSCFYWRYNIFIRSSCALTAGPRPGNMENVIISGFSGRDKFRENRINTGRTNV